MAAMESVETAKPETRWWRWRSNSGQGDNYGKNQRREVAAAMESVETAKTVKRWAMQTVTAAKSAIATSTTAAEI